MKGTILAVSISEKKGEKKRDIGECLLVKDFGLFEDAHGGFEKRRVSLLAKEGIDKIRARGLDVGFGDFAEVLTEGVVKVGDTIEIVK